MSNVDPDQNLDEGPAPESVASPQKTGPLSAIVGRTTQGKGKTEDVRSQGRPQPPPGYRDSYADFVRRLATPQK